MTTRLIFIRHGITEWNKQRRYCGRKDVPLSRQGKIQVLKLRPGFKHAEIDGIYCSDRKRALATRALIFGKRDFTKVKQLREIDFGVLEGLRHEQILKKYPQAYKKWLRDPFRANIPRAETMADFKKRITGAVRRIVGLNPGKTIAIVCHGGVIGIFVSSILKSRRFWKYVPSPASVTLVRYGGNKYSLDKFNLKRMPKL